MVPGTMTAMLIVHDDGDEMMVDGDGDDDDDAHL